MGSTLQFMTMASKSGLRPSGKVCVYVCVCGRRELSALETKGLGCWVFLGLVSKPQASEIASEAAG